MGFEDAAGDPVAELLSRLRLDREARIRGVLVVEGKSDRSVLATTIGIDRRQIFRLGGRVNVLRAAQRLDEAPLPGVVLVADRDFEGTDSEGATFAWLVYYDRADLESMMLESPALERFLDEWASAEKLAEFGGLSVVRATLEKALREVSVLRRENAAQGLGILFDEIDLRAVFEADGSVKELSLVGRVANASARGSDEIRTLMGKEPGACPHTGACLVRGKDAMEVLSVLLRKAIGSLSAQQVKGAFVEKSMRLTMLPGDFDDTPFVSRLADAREGAAQSFGQGSA